MSKIQWVTRQQEVIKTFNSIQELKDYFDGETETIYVKRDGKLMKMIVGVEKMDKSYLVTEQPRKRLFADIEVSPNVVVAWRPGYNLTINPGDILEERAIICVSYKWDGEDKVHSLKWQEGDDKNLVREIIKVMNEADEIVGHNFASFDLKFIRGRALYHSIPMLTQYKVYDTLKYARRYFGLNSYKLDYIASYLGLGHKITTTLQLWKDCMTNNPKAMKKMIKYCSKDVLLNEEVFYKMKKYTESEVHHGDGKLTCPECGHDEFRLVKTLLNKSGVVRRTVQCTKCGNYSTVSNNTYLKMNIVK